MRKLIATVFNCSVDGFLADEGTDFWDFCFSVPENAEPNDPSQHEFLRSAHAHVFGRNSYEGISAAMMAATDHPFSPILTAAPKVVFSRTMTTAGWANTTIAAGETAAEVEKLRRGGDGHIIVWGGVGLWRSLMELDLLDELHISLYPYIAGEGTRLFDGVPKSYQLDLISSAPASSGVIELRYARHR
ncbi:MAG: dihydrofolate reductase family protein [Dehalococcoidia bacterium]